MQTQTPSRVSEQSLELSERATAIGGIILLGGAVRSTEFTSAIQRSILDLPLGGGASLLSHWESEISALSRHLGMSGIPARVIIGRNSPQPTSAARITIERDPVEFRGTAGILRDLAQDYGDDDLLLIANSNHVAIEPLSDQVERLLSATGDVRLLAAHNHAPAGLMLLRRGVLHEIAPTGFVDFKEQALPAIARRHAVRVIAAVRSPGFSIRSWEDYLAALRARHRGSSDETDSPYEESWRPRFRIVEEPADVDGAAVVHDSVILRGGRIEHGATVVRSLIGPTGLVRRGQSAIGQVITGPT